MKRWIALALALVLSLSVVACGKEAETENTPAPQAQTTAAPTEKESGFDVVGSTVTYGVYTSDKCPDEIPLEWTVVYVEGNRALLLSKNACYFSNGHLGTIAVEGDWNSSALKEKLNTEFYAHFNDSEKMAIAEGENGKIFCLSREEFQNYVLDKSYVLERANSYIVEEEKRGTKYHGSGWCSWWLRDTEGGTAFYVARSSGEVKEEKVSEQKDSILVRPAFWLDLTAVDKG